MPYKPHKMLPRKDIQLQLEREELKLKLIKAVPESELTLTARLAAAYIEGMIEAYKNVLG